MTRAQRESFSHQVLAELAPHVPPLACCRGALVEGIRAATSATDDAPGAVLSTARAVAARAALQALLADGVAARVIRVRAPRHQRWQVVADRMPVPSTDRNCCLRSRLRGAFLGSGLVSRPGAPPQLEITCRSSADAAALAAAAGRLRLVVRPLQRRGRSVLAIRSTAGVGDFLSTIGAQKGRLDFEEGRVEGEVRSGVNRRINAETANLRRTVAAGMRQAEAALVLIDDGERWRRLGPALREAATLRRDHPTETLERLARRAGVSRPAMAGRLHRLVAIAGNR